MALESERSFLESLITVTTVAPLSIHTQAVFPTFMSICMTFIDILSINESKALKQYAILPLQDLPFHSMPEAQFGMQAYDPILFTHFSCIRQGEIGSSHSSISMH